MDNSVYAACLLRTVVIEDLGLSRNGDMAEGYTIND